MKGGLGSPFAAWAGVVAIGGVFGRTEIRPASTPRETRISMHCRLTTIKWSAHRVAMRSNHRAMLRAG